MGVILSEPSLVAVYDDEKKRIKTVGKDAKRLLGKTARGTTVISPIVEGEIDKESYATDMLKSFVQKLELGNRTSMAEAVVTVPSGTENPAVKKFKQAFAECGINKVYFIEAPIAAAVGSGAPISASTPCFIIDMGGSITGVSAVSLDGVIAGVTANIGGNGVDSAIIDLVEELFRLRIGQQTAEKIKCEIGSLLPGDTTSMVIYGMDIESGNPRSLQIQSSDIVEPIKAYFHKVNEVASMVMSKLPPEVCAEIRRNGVYLTGGMSRIVGLEEFFYDECSLTVRICEDPHLSAVQGAGKIIQNDKVYKRLRFD